MAAVADPGSPGPADQRRAVLTLAGVQFVAAMDHMLILPLGPDLALGVDLPLDWLGAPVAAYTLAAALTGLLLVRVLDRIPRRTALVACCAGLTAAALLAGLSTSPAGLLAARLFAGAMGAPVIALTQAGVADRVPEARRGRALATVLTANAVASVIGVPLALALGDIVDWRAAFHVVALTAFVAALAVARLPTTAPEPRSAPAGGPRRIHRHARRCALLVALASGATFMLAPHLSTFVQFNLGLPRAELATLYGIGGLAAVIGLRFAGRVVDRWGTVPAIAATTVGLVGMVVGFILVSPPLVPLTIGFAALLSLLAMRNVAVRTLINLVPERHERAGFLALMTSAQFLSSAAAALGSGLLLETAAGGRLENLPTLAWLAVAASLLVPLVARGSGRAAAAGPP